jgi:hypothetical protein
VSFGNNSTVSDLFRAGSGTGFLSTQSQASEQGRTEGGGSGAAACQLNITVFAVGRNDVLLRHMCDICLYIVAT